METFLNKHRRPIALASVLFLPIFFFWYYIFPVALPPDIYSVLKAESDVPVELYSMVPRFDDRKPSEDVPRFYGNRILGKITLPPEQARLAFKDVLQSYQRSDPESQLGCFFPRHGVSFDKNGAHYDLLICFGCKQIVAYRNNELILKDGLTWYFKGERTNLDAAFEKAGIPLFK